MGPEPTKGDSTESSSNLTRLLQRMQDGDERAGEKAIGIVYGELHRIAEKALAHERPDPLLQATVLINEAYAHLVKSEGLTFQNRGHFFAIASQQMRRILVDHARARKAQRRGSGAIHLEIEDLEVGAKPRGIDLLVLDEALAELQKVDRRAAQTVEMRFFGGYRDREVSEALGVSFATVRRDWEFARAWLFRRLKEM